MEAVNSAPKNLNNNQNIQETRSKILKEDNVGWKFWNKRRYVVGLLASFGFSISCILRASLSIAIVAMTTNSDNRKAEFQWDSETRGLVLGSFFYGYICTQFLGGWLSARIGGKRVFGIGIGVTALLALITPPLVRTSVYLLIALRILQGVFEGVTVPCMSSIWANWAPPLERSKLGMVGLTGYAAGNIFSMPISALIAEKFGWSKIFYIYGFIGLIWWCLWWYFVTDKPEDDTRITESELAFIQQSLTDDNNDNNNKNNNNNRKKKISHPWKKIFKSTCTWAIFLAHFVENWGFHTINNQIPMYMVDVLNFKIEKTGYLAGSPYVCAAFFFPLAAYLADYLRSKNYLTTTNVRKIFTCLGFLGQAFFMILAGFLNWSYGIIFCIVIAITIGCFASAGFFVNYLDIAPQHASVLMGIGHTIATIPGIVSPSLTGFIVKNKSASEWRIVFIIVGTIYFIGAVIYVIFASGEKQKWADYSNKKESKVFCVRPEDVDNNL